MQGAGYDEVPVSELAEVFGVTPQAVRKWMNAETIPKSSRLPLIARKLNVRHVWLLEGELPVRLTEMSEDNQSYDTKRETLVLSEDEAKLLSCYRRLPKAFRKTINAMVSEASRHVGHRK